MALPNLMGNVLSLLGVLLVYSLKSGPWARAFCVSALALNLVLLLVKVAA